VNARVPIFACRARVYVSGSDHIVFGTPPYSAMHAQHMHARTHVLDLIDPCLFDQASSIWPHAPGSNLISPCKFDEAMSFVLQKYLLLTSIYAMERDFSIISTNNIATGMVRGSQIRF
jgi:hypothetical protein